MEANTTTALRAQLELELKNTKLCGYESYQCSQLTIEGSKYCLKHILNDKNAPYKQCSYTYQNSGKRCNLPAPRGDKKEYGLCSEHALKTTLSRNKQNANNPPPLSAEALLTNLSHYVKKTRNRSASSSSYLSDDEKNVSEDIGESKVLKNIDPFVDIDANSVYSAQCNEVLDMCSESESDVEPSTYASVWHDANADSSDNESIDSEEEDPLKHANVYTAEEISLLTRDKLVRLQSLYIEQYKHLRYLLRERRRKYLHSLKREKETCCNIYNQVRDNPKEQRLYKKLKQYNKYHRAFGVQAILDKRLHDLRAKISDGTTVKTNYSKCTFTEGGVKCSNRVVPMAKYCRKHILEDANQVLFKVCGKINGDIECNTPVEAIFDDSTCKLHMEIPPIRSYSQPRKESDSDIDDTLELPPHYAMPTNHVKNEIIDYSLPQDLPKMKTLPSILFEDSAESLSSTLQYSTSEFNDNFTEQSSIDVIESSTASNAEVNILDDTETNGSSQNLGSSRKESSFLGKGSNITKQTTMENAETKVEEEEQVIKDEELEYIKAEDSTIESPQNNEDIMTSEVPEKMEVE